MQVGEDLAVSLYRMDQLGKLTSLQLSVVLSQQAWTRELSGRATNVVANQAQPCLVLPHLKDSGMHNY